MSPRMDAGACPDGHVTYPPHTLCPECGKSQEQRIDLSDRTAEIVTWTTSMATPPGVREPNHLAIVEFDLDGEASAAGSGGRTESDDGGTVRALGQLTTGDVETGDAVRPVYVEQLREPGVGIKSAGSAQDWDGFRFEPVD